MSNSEGVKIWAIGGKKLGTTPVKIWALRGVKIWAIRG